MELTKVSLIVIAADTLKGRNGKDYTNNKFYDVSSDGDIFSTPEEIKVNKTISGFSILYTDEDLKQLDIMSFTSELVILLMNNIPNGFSIDVKYFYQDTQDEFHVDYEVIIPLLKINDIIETLSGELTRNNESYVVKYIRDDSITDIKRSLDESWESAAPKELVNQVTDVKDNVKGIELDTDDDFEVDKSVVDTLTSLFGDLDLDVKEKKKSKKGHKGHPKSRSRVFRESKNPKRDIKRHGVIVSHDKDDIKYDERILRNFLKEFIPGKQEWLKEFRDELAERWMSMYTIRLKELKKLEKIERNKKKDKERRKRNKEILDFTRNMFTVPIDSWDDPNK